MKSTLALLGVGSLALASASDGSCSDEGTCVGADEATMLQMRSLRDKIKTVASGDPKAEAPTYDSRLSAYWESGNCGVHGNDWNWHWCDNQAGNCRQTVSVATDICDSGQAELVAFNGDGNANSYTSDGCNYFWHAQYQCTTPNGDPVYDSQLSAYWESGNCGVHGNDWNWGWCGNQAGNCPQTVDTDLCETGQAEMVEYNGDGSANSYSRDGCNYFWHAQYQCTTPYVVVRTHSKCPHQHGDRLFRNPNDDDGSDSITLEQCYAQCATTEGCNHFSWGPWQGGNVCMGCTSLTNAQTHEDFTTYDMPGLTRYTIDGCLRDGADDFPLTGSSDPAAVSDVRCCSMDGRSGVSQDFEGGEEFFRNGNLHSEGCLNGQTFLAARAACAARNMRLCAPHEIDVTCGSGCWHNHHAVWVETPTVGVTTDGCSTDNRNSNPSGYPGSDDSGELIPDAQKTIDETAAVRCCSHNGDSCESNVFGGCNDAETFIGAQELCSNAGLRLCSKEEMNTCCGTGCWFNHFSVWTFESPPECYGFSSEACELAAQAQGLLLGGAGYDFSGDFQTKGCYAYTSGQYAGRAYYGLISGAEVTDSSGLNSGAAAESPKFRPSGIDCAP